MSMMCYVLSLEMQKQWKEKDDLSHWSSQEFQLLNFFVQNIILFYMFLVMGVEFFASYFSYQVDIKSEGGK